MKYDKYSAPKFRVLTGVALFFALLVFSINSSAYAQDAEGGAEEEAKAEVAEDEGPPKKLTPGVIANVGSYSNRPGAIDVETGDSAPGGEASPVTASIRRSDASTCVVTIRNSSDAGYSVRLHVIGTEKGRKVLERFVGATVPAGGETERQVSGCRKGLNFQVVLKSGTKL